VRDAFYHSIALLVAVCFTAVGWTVAHNPDRTLRAFTFRAESGPRVLVSFVRIFGWACLSLFGVGAMIFLGQIAYDLIRVHQ
jgi:hypothetical protein